MNQGSNLAWRNSGPPPHANQFEAWSQAMHFTVTPAGATTFLLRHLRPLVRWSETGIFGTHSHNSLRGTARQVGPAPAVEHLPGRGSHLIHANISSRMWTPWRWRRGSQLGRWRQRRLGRAAVTRGPGERLRPLRNPGTPRAGHTKCLGNKGLKPPTYGKPLEG